jgi:hypothetical protein
VEKAGASTPHDHPIREACQENGPLVARKNSIFCSCR